MNDACTNMLILVPVYNEWPHLLPLLQDLRRHFPEILVVDNGSHDKSFLSRLREAGFEYLSLPFNLGHWSAIQSGFRYALLKGFDNAVTFDGNGQHVPEEIFKILNGVEKGYDLVIGENNDRGGFLKKGCWKILRGLSGIQVTDFTSGFRGYSRRAMREFTQPMLINLEYQDLGVLLVAQRKGLRMTEVHVRMRERFSQKSKVFPTLTSVLRYLLVTLTFILARRP